MTGLLRHAEQDSWFYRLYRKYSVSDQPKTLNFFWQWCSSICKGKTWFSLQDQQGKICLPHLACIVSLEDCSAHRDCASPDRWETRGPCQSNSTAPLHASLDRSEAAMTCLPCSCLPLLPILYKVQSCIKLAPKDTFRIFKPAHSAITYQLGCVHDYQTTLTIA